MNYILTPVEPGSNRLNAHGTYIAEDALRNSHDLYLSEENSMDPVNGHIIRKYRLNARDHHTLVQARRFSIGCPKCHGTMRPADSRTLDLYECPNCTHE